MTFNNINWMNAFFITEKARDSKWQYLVYALFWYRLRFITWIAIKVIKPYFNNNPTMQKDTEFGY